MRYDIILFDVDDTLLDFQKAERVALEGTFKAYEVSCEEAVINRYIKINNELWKSFERGEISKEQLLNTRFARFFKEMRLEKDGVKCNEDYLNALSQGAFLMPGALETCKMLSEYCSLYIVTNGVSKTQHSRIRLSAIKDYFKDIFVSEDVGYQKPLKEFFDYVFEKINLIDKSRVLIVGDSLTSDIQGGNNAGIDTCWYNPKGIENTKKVNCTYEINNLQDLLSIIKS